MSGYQEYKEKSIYSMNSSGLLFLPYDETIGRLSKAEYALEDKEYGMLENCLLQTTGIVRYLIDILNMNLPVSGDLYRIYSYLICDISKIKAGRERQRDEMDRIKHILSELREAFEEANREAVDVHMVQGKGLIGQEENVGPNTEQTILLLQRRYSTLREVSRLAEELQEAISCSDQVSASLLMEMRTDEMAKIRLCQSDIRLMAESKPEHIPVIRGLMRLDPFIAYPSGRSEGQKAFELR